LCEAEGGEKKKVHEKEGRRRREETILVPRISLPGCDLSPSGRQRGGKKRGERPRGKERGEKRKKKRREGEKVNAPDSALRAADLEVP